MVFDLCFYELNNNLVYYDEGTDTLYINSTGSNYTYDSTNQILYVGGGA